MNLSLGISSAVTKIWSHSIITIWTPVVSVLFWNYVQGRFHELFDGNMITNSVMHLNSFLINLRSTRTSGHAFENAGARIVEI